MKEKENKEEKKDKIVTCECCGKQFESVDESTTCCPECENHWIND